MDERRQVEVSDENAAFLDEVVAAGEFRSGEDVVDEALREWRERRDNHGYTVEELKRLVDEGLRSGPGRYGSMQQIKDEARHRMALRKSA